MFNRSQGCFADLCDAAARLGCFFAGRLGIWGGFLNIGVQNWSKLYILYWYRFDLNDSVIRNR
ncbi:hypothetical protein B5P44_21350 [Mycobacterium sp. CBMA 213]|nr:hypothetical protein [Mycolicibacterium sp. CBMA 213]